MANYFHNPFGKQECAKCGQRFDDRKYECPHCHEPVARTDTSLRPCEAMTMLHPIREIILFIVVFQGLQLVAYLISFIAQTVEYNSLVASGLSGEALNNALYNYVQSAQYDGLVNFTTYGILFAAVLAIINKDIVRLFKSIFTAKAFMGLLGFAAIIIFDIVYSLLTNDLRTGTNINQTTVESMITVYPVLSTLIIGIIGPFVEECGYRLGLFNFTRRINVVLAYLVASIVFGLIHIHDFTSLNEWLSYPPYVVSGLVFAFLYDRFGFGASLCAHLANNLYSVIVTIIAGN